MEKDLSTKNIAVLVTDGFEQSEFEEPVKAAEKAGAEITVISLKKGKVKAWKNHNWGDEIEAILAVADAKPADYDALILPGGVMNPDKLRMDEKAVAFAKSFFDEGKPVAAICHGPWLLVEAGVVNGKTLTSYPSLKTDISNAGGKWINEEVVVDGNLVTSRTPKDLPAFCQRMVEVFSGLDVQNTAHV